MTAPAPVTSIFSMADCASVRRDRLCVVAKTYCPQAELSDQYILEQLQAAEAETQRDMRLMFTPRLAMPFSSSPADLAAAQAAYPTVPIVNEPGYDYTPELFTGNTWGLIMLRQKLVTAVNSITFNYPLPTDKAYTIPPEWIRCDFKYGILNLVPTAQNTTLPLNAFLLSVLGGGYTTPFLMQIQYVFGMQNAKADYPDLVNQLKRLAVCMIVENLFLPQSGSISVDGLSQSLSLEVSKYREEIEKRLAKIAEQIRGISLQVC